MEVFLVCVFIMAIVVTIFCIVSFSVELIIHNKQMSTRKYDIGSVLDRWESAEKQFQKDNKIEEDVCDSTFVSSQDQTISVEKPRGSVSDRVIDISLIADKGIIL